MVYNNGGIVNLAYQKNGCSKIKIFIAGIVGIVGLFNAHFLFIVVDKGANNVHVHVFIPHACLKKRNNSIVMSFYSNIKLTSTTYIAFW